MHKAVSSYAQLPRAVTRNALDATGAERRRNLNKAVHVQYSVRLYTVGWIS